MRRSDHWPFIQCGILGIWGFTGLRPDYHTTNDRPERINYIKMEKAARHLFPRLGRFWEAAIPPRVRNSAAQSRVGSESQAACPAGGHQSSNSRLRQP